MVVPRGIDNVWACAFALLQLHSAATASCTAWSGACLCYDSDCNKLKPHTSCKSWAIRTNTGLIQHFQAKWTVSQMYAAPENPAMGKIGEVLVGKTEGEET